MAYENVIKEIDNEIVRLEKQKDRVYHKDNAILKAIYYNPILRSNLKNPEADKVCLDIDDKILKLKIQKAELLDNIDQNSMNGNTSILNASINKKTQTIRVGNHKLNSFDDVYRFLEKDAPLTSSERSQFKGGISLIYAIVELLNKNNESLLLMNLLLELIKEFRTEWSNWKFSKQGIKKDSLNKNDCLRAEQIFKKCGESIRIRISLDKKKILIEELS